MTNRIDHVDASLEDVVTAADAVADGDNMLANVAAHSAQTHAILALVEQQRIANLIALSEFRDLPGGGQKAYAIYERGTYELRQDIREGLGL